MAEVGRIEKPSAERYEGKRKLYCVANVYLLKDSPEDYKELVGRYWKEAAGQVEKLEMAGTVGKIFCESIHAQGAEALEALAGINEPAHVMVKERVERGAALFPVEKEEIFGPFLDWANCLSVVRTQEVFAKVYGFYTELANERLKHILEVIEENLSEGETGLLLMRDEDRVQLQFPPDIEVFLVTPPSYDDILRWFREKMKGGNP
jgi:hypothetical protein